jgi:hypothetical protein
MLALVGTVEASTAARTGVFNLRTPACVEGVESSCLGAGPEAER